MKTARVLLPLLLVSLLSGPAGAELPETRLSYSIKVDVDPVSRAISGTETLRWTNPSSEPVDRIPIHLYLNAFSNQASTWLQEARRNGFGRFNLEPFYRRFDDPWGWIDLDQVSVIRPEGGAEVPWGPVQPDDGNVFDRTLVELSLPHPVGPGEELELAIRFSGRLPRPFARTGCIDRYCLVGQWFPKIAVLETKGVRGAKSPRWAARQFHATTEFYADFADFDVTIEAPEGWLVAATGRRTGDAEPGLKGRRKHHFVQRAVHDFAFMLGEGFTEEAIWHRPAGGGPAVEVHYVMPTEFTHQLPRWQQAAEGTLDTLGLGVGPYPYDTLTIIFPRAEGSTTDGMEYPTFFVSSTVGGELDHWPQNSAHFAEHTLIHELTHQYFYGLLASNEQEEAFLDEGFTTYWEGRAAEDLYGAETSAGTIFGRPAAMLDFMRMGLASVAERVREPLRHQPSSLFEGRTHAMQFYARTAVTLATGERVFGREQIDQAFRSYYRRFAFGHPDAEGFIEAASEGGGPALGGFLREALAKGRMPDYSVARLRARRVSTPLGSWLLPEGRVTIERETGDDHREILDQPFTRDAEGKIWIEVTDPGWFREDSSRRGSVAWRGFDSEDALEPSVETPAAAEEDSDSEEPPALYQSEIKLSGPGWDNLPVDVELVFEDGTRVRDRWDGRSPWRSYRVLRPSKVSEVRIDPDDTVLVDLRPENNGLRLEAEKGLQGDWAGWIAAVSQWIAGGASLWL